MEERLGEFQPDSRSGAIPQRQRQAEPLRPDMPAGSAEYRKVLETFRNEKDSAQVQQRADHRAARGAQTAEFRKERAALYQGGKWSGNALNVARSLLAADHAKRRAELIEQQKRERDSLRSKFGQRKTFEQFLVARGTPQLAEQWRYRSAENSSAAIFGEGDEIPRKRDIRDFTAQVRPASQTLANEIRYSSRTDPSRVSFTDRGAPVGRAEVGNSDHHRPRRVQATLRAACRSAWNQDQQSRVAPRAHPQPRRAPAIAGDASGGAVAEHGISDAQG
jgi:hypothetical protein